MTYVPELSEYICVEYLDISDTLGRIPDADIPITSSRYEKAYRYVLADSTERKCGYYWHPHWSADLANGNAE